MIRLTGAHDSAPSHDHGEDFPFGRFSAQRRKPRNVSKTGRSQGGREFLARIGLIGEREIRNLASFLGVPVDEATLVKLSSEIHVPESQGRYLHRDWRGDFTADQLARLDKLGYRG